MILSKTTSYALRILIQMSQERKTMISAQYLHSILNINRPYLRRLLTDLSKLGFVKSTLGRNGGYVFARQPEEISIYEVIEAIEGNQVFEGCILGVKNCRQSPQCIMHGFWAETSGNMANKLRQTSLASLTSENELHR